MAVTVAEAPDRERYEITVDGELAGFAEYRGPGATRAFTHTEIDERFEGQGLGSTLIRETLDDVRRHGRHVLPICPFVKDFLDRHDEYLDLVEPRIRRSFGLREPASSA